MERIDDRIVLSASELTAHLTCSRLTALELGAPPNLIARAARPGLRGHTPVR